MAKSLLAICLLSSTACSLSVPRDATQCRSLPGDAAWPTPSIWTQFNSSIEGRLIATIPVGAVCHAGGYGPVSYNESACANLQENIDAPMTYETTPAAIMSAFFQNQSCSAYTPTAKPCELGALVNYSVNVSSANDVARSIVFAKEHNIRLVIKNTGHDFLGGSTGTGGLALWTHNLKSTSVVDVYAGEGNYTGPAIKLGAGVAGFEAYAAVNQYNYRIVGGDCPTVGIAGGYASGGGHSLLNGVYGMGADQVLEWEVVTADGLHLTATPFENQDLYWALSGGGAGTFAVVLSMTYKIYEESIVGGALLAFNDTSNDKESYQAALEAWWEAQPSIVDHGPTILWVVLKGSFSLQGTTAPNMTADQVGQLYAPYLATLDQLGINYTFSTSQSPTYYDHFNRISGGLPYGSWPGTYIQHSRLIPRSLLDDKTRITNLTTTMIKAVNENNTEAGYQFGCQSMNVKDIPAHYDNAVLPFWRDSIAVCINIALWNWTVPYEEMLSRKAHMARTIAPAMESVTPDWGAYRNEIDVWAYPQEDTARWQHDFFGTNYPRLRQIKDKYDPQSVFYANLAVGSEDWTFGQSGRLCRA